MSELSIRAASMSRGAKAGAPREGWAVFRGIGALAWDEARAADPVLAQLADKLNESGPPVADEVWWTIATRAASRGSYCPNCMGQPGKAQKWVDTTGQCRGSYEVCGHGSDAHTAATWCGDCLVGHPPAQRLLRLLDEHYQVPRAVSPPPPPAPLKSAEQLAAEAREEARGRALHLIACALDAPGDLPGQRARRILQAIDCLVDAGAAGSAK